MAGVRASLAGLRAHGPTESSVRVRCAGVATGEYPRTACVATARRTRKSRHDGLARRPPQPSSQQRIDLSEHPSRGNPYAWRDPPSTGGFRTSTSGSRRIGPLPNARIPSSWRCVSPNVRPGSVSSSDLHTLGLTPCCPVHTQRPVSRQRTVLRMLYLHRYLAVDQIATLVFPTSSRRACQACCTTLHRKGFVHRFELA